MSAPWRTRLGVPAQPPGLIARLAWLHLGLVTFGATLALLVRARLGLDPWDVLSQGIANQLHVQLGWVVEVIGALVLLAWIPLRQRPGIGTVMNVIVVGLVINATLDLIPYQHAMAIRIPLLALAIVGSALATGCYIGAGLGPGPRDGLMTGLAARGLSIRIARAAIELTVLAVGFALGGPVGVGTVLYAGLIGPLVHLTIPWLDLDGRGRHRAGTLLASTVDGQVAG